ncbi:MAG: DUF4384 domain-containing protein [Tannerellaceae bacterium]|jgi:hypothetical protein|nr:DUF4384 domain-containing protein [Tannerellaceae bacterium]
MRIKNGPKPCLYGLLTALLLCINCPASQAQTVHVTAQGVWDMANIRLEEAKRLALENAKADALRQSGLPEEFIVISAGAVSDRINGFVSYSNSELSGEIVYYRVTDEQVLNEGARYFYRVLIEATVKTGKMKRDLEFDAFISGIRTGVYPEGETFAFSLRPSKDCYVHIFWIDAGGEGAPLYPNPAEPPELLRAGETYDFPRTQRYRTKKETQEATEAISLVFAFTRKNIPFTGACTLENIQQWITAIPSDERKIKYDAIVISRR